MSFMNSQVSLRFAITLAASALAAGVPAAGGVTLHVATTGSDTNPGTASRPFATLERARDAVRALKGEPKAAVREVMVEVRGGIYELLKPPELTAEDSGHPNAPVVWRSSQPGAARLLGGKFVSGWSLVTDAGLLARFDSAARGRVWQANLRAQGIVTETNLAHPPGLGAADPGIEVFFNEQPMMIARWPNEGVAYIKQVEDNLIGKDPLLVETNRFDFRLRKDSPAWSIGFKPIPFEKIGLYKDALRASWPVVHPADPEPAKDAKR